MTRRRVLLFLAAAASSLLALLALLTDRRGVWLALERVLAPRLDPSSAPGPLSRRDVDTVLAYADVLLSDTGVSAAARVDLEGHVRDRCQHEPGYRDAYRLAVTVLDDAAGGEFASRPFDERRRIVHRRNLHRHDVRARDWLWTVDRRGLAVRALAARDLVAGFFLSSAGWALLGYETFPGRCRNLSDYTRAG